MGAEMIFPSPIGRGWGPFGTAEWEGEGILATCPALTLPALRASLPLPTGEGQ